MGRHRRMRFVKYTPNNFYFREFDDSIPNSDRFIILNIAEFEAMRLKHYVNLNQKDAAEKMGVSQPTFSRILEIAHQKATQALIEGKQLRVYGGDVDYKKGFVGYGCLNCNEEWEDETASKDKKINCKNCGSDQVYFLIREPL